MVVTTFELFPKQPIPHTGILKPSYILLACWKWLGDARMHSVIATKPGDDRNVVKALAQAVTDADFVVGHNSKSFDLKVLKARALLHHVYVPPSADIDTLSVARRTFRLSSNRLDAIGRYLGLGQKAHTAPGLWQDAMQGKRRALAAMQTYCAQDVRLLEAVFVRLRPYLSQVDRKRLHTIRRCARCKGIARIPLPKRVSPGRCVCGNWLTTT